MTSKEKIEELHNFIDKISNKIGTLDYLCYQNYLDDIKKDLEILDILKGNANLYVSDINKEVKYIQISITTCDNRFEKVEGWLNEK